MGRGDEFGGSETDLQDKNLLKILEQKAERLCTIREVFAAGFHAGCEHLQPEMGPGRTARNADDGFEQWLRDRARR